MKQLAYLALIFILGCTKKNGPSGMSADAWLGVGPYHAGLALEALPEAPKDAVMAPFCFWIEPGNRVIERPECQALLAKHPTPKACGFQNSNSQGWWTGVIEQDALKVAEGMAAISNRYQCSIAIIDIEGLRASDRDKATAWTAQLIGFLRKVPVVQKISIAVHAKTDDQGLWDGAKAQDWKRYCKMADEILIMAYDYHIPPGPMGELAPLAWVENVLRYGQSVCPTAKLRLGLAAYGYNWENKDAITERAHPIGGAPYFVETIVQRREKTALAARMGINKTFLWSWGMQAPEVISP